MTREEAILTKLGKIFETRLKPNARRKPRLTVNSRLRKVIKGTKPIPNGRGNTGCPSGSTWSDKYGMCVWKDQYSDIVNDL